MSLEAWDFAGISNSPQFTISTLAEVFPDCEPYSSIFRTTYTKWENKSNSSENLI